METLTKTDSYINNQYFGLYKPIKWLNMITEKQLKIFDVFAKKPFAQYTRKEIKEESKEKSNNALALAINLLKREEVLIEEKIGKSGLLTLNLNNDLTVYYIALCNNKRIHPLVKHALENLKKEITEEFFKTTLLGGVFGNCRIAARIRSSKHHSDESVVPYLNAIEDQLKYFGETGERFRQLSRISYFKFDV